jgi:uncharacterized membrane-anchored protein
MTESTMDHPLRAALADELHARPFLRINGSVSLAHIAVYADGDTAIHENLLTSLCRLTGLAEPVAGAKHYSSKWSAGRQLKWERHTEFSTFTFVASRQDTDYFSDLATRHVPSGWFDALEGKRFVAVRIEIVSGKAAGPACERVRDWIDGSAMVGSNVLGCAQVFCDWTIKEDGFSRFMVVDRGLREVQCGRLLQRLYEIETYRMMALLGLPVARDLSNTLDELQLSFVPLIHSMDMSETGHHDAELLVRLTHLAVRVEALAGTAVRFSASRAYEGLVQARIAELREEPIEGIPTIAEFMERRFGPAMQTCKAVFARQEHFAERVARVVALLRTRVNVAQEADSTRLLESMNRTAGSQLRLQHAVEGLSVAAISYYVLSLSSAALRSLHAAALLLDPELIEGMLVVPVVASVLLVMRRTRRAEHIPSDSKQAVPH